MVTPPEDVQLRSLKVEYFGWGHPPASSNKRAAQSRIVRMMIPTLDETRVNHTLKLRGRVLIAPISNPRPLSFGVTHNPKSFRIMVGRRGSTRHLCRDRRTRPTESWSYGYLLGTEKGVSGLVWHSRECPRLEICGQRSVVRDLWSDGTGTFPKAKWRCYLLSPRKNRYGSKPRRIQVRSPAKSVFSKVPAPSDH
jgi:hypothetical protein